MPRKRHRHRRLSPPREPSPKQAVAHRLAHLQRELLLALGVLLGFSGFELWLGHTASGERLRLLTYEWLQQAIPPARLVRPPGVLVVDLSGFPPVADTDSDSELRITPREVLQLLLDRCRLARSAEAQAPLALGFDLDLSPETNGYLPAVAATRRFLDTALRAQHEGLPVAVGVRRMEVLGSAAWLGAPEYAPLAASITRPRGPVVRLPWEYRFGSNAVPLPTLSRALAGSAITRNPRLGAPPSPAWLAPFLVEIASTRNHAGIPGFGVSDYLVDYSSRTTLATEVTDLRDLLALPLADLVARLADRVVLVGDAIPGTGADVAIIPGEPEPVPGVLVQACGIETLLNGRLRELHHLAGFALSLGLSVASILLLHRVCSRHARSGEVSPVALTILLAAFLTGFLILVAWYAMHFWRVVLLDTFAVCLVLAVHTFADLLVGAVDWRRLRRAPAHPLPALVVRPSSHGEP